MASRVATSKDHPTEPGWGPPGSSPKVLGRIANEIPLRDRRQAIVLHVQSCSCNAKEIETLNNLASGAVENRQNEPLLVPNRLVTLTSQTCAQVALRTFKRLGSCSALFACCIFACVLVVSSAARLSAQTSGSISGHVADATGAVIPDAHVALTNVGTGAVRSTVTTGIRRLPFSRRSAWNL